MIGNDRRRTARGSRARRSGLVRRRMITPMLTSTNANSVPMLTSSTISPSGTKAARIAISDRRRPAVERAGRAGARADLREAARGSRPSRHIAKMMRRLPVEDRSATTLVIAISAPSDEDAAPPRRSRRRSSSAVGERRVAARRAVGRGSDADRRRPRRGCTGRCRSPREPIIPLGMSRCSGCGPPPRWWRPRRSRCRRRR